MSTGSDVSEGEPALAFEPPPGVAGAVRPVAQAAARLKEAAKLGFARAVIPESARAEAGDPGLNVNDVGNLTSLVADIAALGKPRGGTKSGGQDG